MPTLSSDVVHVQIAADAWGTRLILKLCRGLTHEQFHKKFDIGLGTLHLTLTHMISAQRRWTDRLAGRAVRAMLHTVPRFPHLGGEDMDRTVDELSALLADAERDLMAVAEVWRNRLGTTVSLEWPGDDGTTKTHTFSRAAVFVHLSTHGAHHRAQCLNMLRHLNVPGLSDKLPDPSAVDWQSEAESPPVVKGP
jgi:uncharacterized damage-inducible protein DinB